MSISSLIDGWKEVRAVVIEEAVQIPADQFAFRAAPETRSVAELLQHIIESQKILIGEACRPDTNLMRQSFAGHTKEYAPEVGSVEDKDGLLELMRASMEIADTTIRSYGDKLNDSMQRFDGRTMSKLQFLHSGVSHEMYHRGQLTVYERLLEIEPALTKRFNKLFAKPG